MRLVIDMPETAYNYFAQGLRYADDVEMAILAIVDGTPLPKGHGRLIDADNLIQELSVVSSRPIKSQLYILKEAPTIIEADTESEDKA